MVGYRFPSPKYGYQNIGTNYQGSPSVVPNIEVELGRHNGVRFTSLRLTHLARTPGLLACHNTGALDANPHLMEVDRLLGEILAIFRLLSSDSDPGLCSVVPENLLFHQHLP